MAITKVSPALLDLDSGITISTADNSTQLTLTSTDADSSAGPVMEFYRNSGSPADNDAAGLIYFTGENDADEKVFYGQIYTQIKDASDGTEDASIDFISMVGGTGRSRMYLAPTETVFNEASVDLDFRVESDGNANMLFVDGGTNQVGIGTVPENAYTSYTALEISRSGSIYANNSADDLNIGTNFYLESGGNWRAKNTETASLMQFDNGAFNFYTAASTTADNNISWNHKIAFPNAGGIAFNGDTAAANSLDDYEEGTWQPQIKNITSMDLVQNTSYNWYVKIGRFVSLSAYIKFDAASSDTSAIEINNLPFATDSATAVAGSMISRYSSNTAGIAPYINGTFIAFYEINTSGSWTQVAYDDVGQFECHMSISYFTT